jgi:hypothetical protein
VDIAAGISEILDHLLAAEAVVRLLAISVALDPTAFRNPGLAVDTSRVAAPARAATAVRIERVR